MVRSFKIKHIILLSYVNKSHSLGIQHTKITRDLVKPMHTLYLFLASKIHKVLRWSCPLLLWPSIILLAAIGFKRGFNHSFFKELSWLQQLKNMNYFLINLPFSTFFNMGWKHHRQILTSHLPKKPQFTWTCEGCLWKKKKITWYFLMAQFGIKLWQCKWEREVGK